MEEIKINDYVRTKQGTISKITEIAVGIKDVKDTLYFTEKYEYYHCNDIVKHSKNIKDLIEAGDIIKYKINILRVELGEVEKYIDARSFEKYLAVNGCNLEEVDILEILTKEKFESECFKVEV